MQTVAPFMPHLAEACWAALGRDTIMAETPWPEADRALVIENTVTLPVQVNGRKRLEITVERETEAHQIEAMIRADAGLLKVIEMRAIKKVIVVPGRIVNVVV